MSAARGLGMSSALTPLDAARSLAGRAGRFLLHSGSDADGLGRWSFVGCDPSAIWRDGDPFVVLDALPAAAGADDAAPVPLVVGWLGYDLGRTIETVPARTVDDLGLPPFWLARYGAVYRYDHVAERGEIVGDDPAARAALATALARPPVAPEPPRFGPLIAEHAAARHLTAVARAIEYIRAGDIYQVNLARRLRAPMLLSGDGLALYERIAASAPAPYGGLLECGDLTVISDSPELFLARAAGAARVETRPIKGTRARGRDAADDQRLAAELNSDPKEHAEHLMIVDLERNDLGRVAQTGSVVVDDFARLVTLPTVHHLVSTVSAALRPGVTTSQLLRATFPGGSVTGAPKIRAMEIIDELEPVRRGVYTGALGWFGAGGATSLAIVIRTAVIARGALHLHVGGGIVADSRPARELEETDEKAAAWVACLAP